jgi:hypothetical protein
MYQFSRSIYRELAPLVSDDSTGSCRQSLLESCEATVERLAKDRRYFARPAKSLFSDVRSYFPLSDQQYVYRVIDRNVKVAISYLEQLPPGFDIGTGPRECRASTRRGTPCQREPLPGRDYCPSHKHLEEPLEQAPVAAEQTPVAA